MTMHTRYRAAMQAAQRTTMDSHAFQDPISGLRCVLQAGPDVDRLRPGLPGLGVMHGTCPQLADVSPDLDAFYCPACGWNGRISGAWAMDMLHRASGDPQDTSHVG